MTDVEVLKEEPITLAEVKEKLDIINKRDKQLNTAATKTYEYAEHFSKVDNKKIQELKQKLNELNVPRLKERHIVKLIDILPEEIDSLRAVFVGETITVKQEDLNKILEVIKKST